MAKEIYSGHVLEKDTNKGIENVSVTNGRDVVKTDENGFFSIEKWEKGRFIAVTASSGYVCTDFYKEIEKNTDNYDFCFTKSKIIKENSHSFIQVSDSEIGPNADLSWIQEVKAIIEKKNPAFLIHTGDICYEYGLENHIKFMNTEIMGCPTYYIIGNHDYVDGAYGEELYEDVYGPTCYSFEVGDVHYAVTPIYYGDSPSKYDPEDRWVWLKNDLENTDPDMKLVIFNHTKSPTEDYVLPLKFDRLDLKKYNLKAWIFGHYHYNYIDETYGALNISTARPDCGGIDSSVSGIRLITVEKDEIKAKMLYRDLGKSTEPKNFKNCLKLSGNALFCDTLLDENNVYIATSCDDSPCECGVYCANSKDLNINWFYKTKNSVKNNLIIFNEKLVALDTQGYVYCFNKLSGELLWKQKIGVGDALGTSSAMTILDETIFAGCPHEITALDINNGNVKWSFDRRKGENSPAEFVVNKDRLLVSAHWDDLACLNVSNGKEMWANNDKNLRFRSSTPTFINSRMILAADSNAIMLVDAHSGMLETKKTFEDINFSSSGKPCIHNDIAYIPTVNRGVVGFNLNSKKLVSEFNVEKSILFTAPYSGKKSSCVESSPCVYGDELYFGANDGFVYRVDLAKNEIVKRYRAGSAVLGKIAVNDNEIFASAFNGYLVSFEK